MLTDAALNEHSVPGYWVLPALTLGYSTLSPRYHLTGDGCWPWGYFTNIQSRLHHQLALTGSVLESRWFHLEVEKVTVLLMPGNSDRGYDAPSHLSQSGAESVLVVVSTSPETDPIVSIFEPSSGSGLALLGAFDIIAETSPLNRTDRGCSVFGLVFNHVNFCTNLEGQYINSITIRSEKPDTHLWYEHLRL